MSGSETTYDRVNDYKSVRISLARPHDIRAWSFGEVKKPETINYRTYRPESDGLFCQRIFGPERDWECACGKYRGMKYKGLVCDRCGVKIAHSRIRRKRMGHIELAAPVVHIWFFKAPPSRLGNLLAMKTTSLEKIVYFQNYVVVDPGETQLVQKQLLTEEEYRTVMMEHPGSGLVAEMGAEALRKLLVDLDLVSLSAQLRTDLSETTAVGKRKELINRLRIVEAIRDSPNQPEWMVLDVIPVIPPDLRPLVLLDSGNFATSDLNDLYRRIINRNNRLKKLVDLNAPEVIIRNEKRMLQQSVDALMDNSRCKRKVVGASNRELKSLTDMIKGKQGRFRENLLGKRVDYSARSVIVVGPKLRLHQCGLPKKIALELYQPFIIRRLKETGPADTIKSAKKMLERRDEEVWDILEEVIRNHPVLLNRAPTLHRMGIQAFEPVLVEGNAIKLHPLVCRGFNADFDGDQMAVHLPLSIEAQIEAHTLILATNNIFSPANGRPIISPSQDVVMGCYYVSMILSERKGEDMKFASPAEVEMAYSHGVVDLHALIWVRIPSDREIKGEGTHRKKTLVQTTVGRIIFNEMLPQGMPFYNMTLRSRDLAQVISDCYERLGRRATLDLLDDMNQLGFRESTLSGLSFATDDLVTPASKGEIIAEAEKKVQRSHRECEDGILTREERYNQVLDAWTHARDEITQQMMQALEEDYRYPGYINPIYLMAHSGARGGVEQIRQLAGMRGLMAKPSGQIIETPILANFREGLSVLEYFSSTHGARKGLADTALKTADSGYLTRKLADVAQNVVVTLHDCGTTQGITKRAVKFGQRIDVTLADAIKGRVSRSNIVNLVSDEVIVHENEMITAETARRIEAMGLDSLQVRSPMTCEAELGVCALCYGMDLSTSTLVEQGMAVGIIAAQSIGEPGTQLTMRTFHIGGAAARALEETEHRTTKAGVIQFMNVNCVRNDAGQLVSLTGGGEIRVLDNRGRDLEAFGNLPIGAELLVEDGQEVQERDVICKWDPHSMAILAEIGGQIRFEDVIEGETLRTEQDNTGTVRQVVLEHKGDLHPQVILEDACGEILGFHYLPEKAHVLVREGQEVVAGTLLARTPREVAGTQDITGGLPRVTEIFEARKPKNPAVIAKIDGVVKILGQKRQGKRTIIVRHESGTEREHIIPHGMTLRVSADSHVRAGDPLVDGPLVPHDILELLGEEAVQHYLVREIQSVYRSQQVEINDKHIEIIVSQMLRKVEIEAVGDTDLLPGQVLDKVDFRLRNHELGQCLKVTNPGDTGFAMGEIVPESVFTSRNRKMEDEGSAVAEGVRPQHAVARTQLLGITKAAVQSSSFLSAASFQETTKVLADAALAGMVDNLVGLKENIILGHLIPAGTGFKLYQDAQIRISDTLEETPAVLETRISQGQAMYPLMNDQVLSEASIGETGEFDMGTGIDSAEFPGGDMISPSPDIVATDESESFDDDGGPDDKTIGGEFAFEK